MILINLLPSELRKPKQKPSVEERFWSKVDKNGPMCERLGSRCWVWTESTTKAGYGRFWVNDTTELAHRVAWEFDNNTKLPTFSGLKTGVLVLHGCDNPPCCNPKHLRAGSHSDNMVDMTARQRAAAGNNNGSRLYPEKLKRGEEHPLRKDPSKAVRGEKQHSAKLTATDVEKIRSEYIHRTTSLSKLAVHFGVSKTSVEKIVYRKTWKHVK